MLFLTPTGTLQSCLFVCFKEEYYLVATECRGVLTKLRYTRVTSVEVVHAYLKQNVDF